MPSDNTLEQDASQDRAVELICRAEFGIVTGGPGTGKTTTLRRALDRLPGRKVELCAPTGKAAKRIKETTGRDARTIHRMLEYKPRLGFMRNRHAPLDAELVVADESSMIDVELAAALFDACSERTRVILIGDADQLPPVGPGRPFADLVSAVEVAVARLSTLHRQALKSWVARNAPRILVGDMVELESAEDFTHVRIDAAADIIPAVCKLAFADADAQILIPQRPGVAGVNAANAQLQAVLNDELFVEGDPVIQREHYAMRRGDRVINTRNDYDLNVFNGELGRLVDFDHGKPIVEYADAAAARRVVYQSYEQAAALELAYALTVHRCVAPDTIVETSRGLMTIAELQRAPSDGDTWIATALGARAYDSFVANPPGRMLRIETDDGYDLTVTPEHGMMTARGDGEYVRVEAGGLREGDWLRLRLGETCIVKRSPPLPPAPRPCDIDPRARHYLTPRLLTADMAEFLGLIVADGTVFDRGFRLTKRHGDVAARFAELCRVLFNVEPREHDVDGLPHVDVCSTMLARWLLTIDGLAPRGKAIPTVVMRAPLAMQCAFLRGLFEDGTVNVRADGRLDHVEWSSCYEPMARVVQTMLLRVGVISSRRERDGQHMLYIYGQHAKRFGEAIGFVASIKRERLAAPTGEQTRYLIPVARGRVARADDPNAAARGYISRHRAQSLGEFADELTYHHVRIARVTPIVGESMCVRVPDGGRFLQNGFDGSNSQGSEFPSVIVVCHSTHSYGLTRQLLYTAVTRTRGRIVIVGDMRGLEHALSAGRVPVRNTTLLERLRGQLDEVIV